jgi:multidrug efflux pump subunit AcrB
LALPANPLLRIIPPDFYTSGRAGRAFEQQLKQNSLTGDAHGAEMDRPQPYFDVDCNRAQALGNSTQQIGDTVRVLAGRRGYRQVQ